MYPSPWKFKTSDHQIICTSHKKKKKRKKRKKLPCINNISYCATGISHTSKGNMPIHICQENSA